MTAAEIESYMDDIYMNLVKNGEGLTFGQQDYIEAAIKKLILGESTKSR